jgi:hypothetical protein
MNMDVIFVFGLKMAYLEGRNNSRQADSQGACIILPVLLFALFRLTSYTSVKYLWVMVGVIAGSDVILYLVCVVVIN